MISTRELAKIAGVSQSTVSRCLNDSHEVSAETKERVRALAREHGYILQKKGSKTICSPSQKIIGILMMRNEFFNDLFINQMLCELYSIIENENYYAMPLLDIYGIDGVERLRSLLSQGMFVGPIVLNRKYDEVVDQYLRSIGLPHVYLIYHLRKSSKQSYIFDTDNFEGGYLATKYLIDLGHRKIATITSPLDEFSDRTEGYKAALEDADIPYDPQLVFHADASYQEYYNITRTKANVFRSATALFSQFDLGAFGSVNALFDAGFRVPEDVSVIGFDGLDVTTMSRPTLSTVKQPYHSLAKLSVDCLLQQSDMSDSQSIRKVYLKPELMIRESTIPFCSTTPR